MPSVNFANIHHFYQNTYFQSVLCLYSVNIIYVQFHIYWNESAIARLTKSTLLVFCHHYFLIHCNKTTFYWILTTFLSETKIVLSFRYISVKSIFNWNQLVWYSCSSSLSFSSFNSLPCCSIVLELSPIFLRQQN